MITRESLSNPDAFWKKRGRQSWLWRPRFFQIQVAGADLQSLTSMIQVAGNLISLNGHLWRATFTETDCLVLAFSRLTGT